MVTIQQNMYAEDYVIFVLMLVGTLAIGVFHACTGGRQSTTSEYLMGNHNLNCFPVSISMTASFFSSILMLGFPAEAYTNGGMYWIYAAGIAIGAFASILIFVPVFHPLKLTSVNDYLLMRYNSRFVAILGTLSNITGMLLYTSIVYFAPATAVTRVTGFPTWASIVIGSVLTIIYTSIGGIKAVIWTDVFQAALMLVGLLTVSITAIMKVGGLTDVWDICGRWDRMNIIDINPDPTIRFTFWSLTIGVGFYDMNRYGTQQTAVQRYCSLKSITMARLCVLGLIPFTTVMTFLASLSGLTMFAYYTKLGCDPLRGGFISNANQLIPHFVADTLNYPGIQEILLASLVSASLSTASSALNACSANMWKDVFTFIWPNISEKRNVLITKLLVVVFGAISTGMAFLFINLGGTVVQMVVTFMSACGGPTTAMFLLGVFFNFTNWIGASTGGVVGFAFALWMGFGSYSINRQRNYLPSTVANCTAYAASLLTGNSTTTAMLPTTLATTTPSLLTSTMAMQPDVNQLHKLYSVSYLWTACFSTTIAFVVGFIVSLISGHMGGRAVPGKLLHPWVRCCYGVEDNEDDQEDNIVKPTEQGNEKSYENEYMKAKEAGTAGGTYDRTSAVMVTKM